MKKNYFLLILLILTLPNLTHSAINSNLQLGSKGQSVIELQNFLIQKGFLTGKATGSYYNLTKKAVAAYQKSVGLPASGFVGPMTRAKINSSNTTINKTKDVTQNGNNSIVTNNPQSNWTKNYVAPIDPILVQWSSSRKLSWNDFKKNPPSESSYSAEILPYINATSETSYSCDIKNGKKFCTFRIDSFRVNAVMDPKNSWVKPDKATDYRLAHEQIHFDITEVFARKLKNQLNSLINTTTSISADTTDYSSQALSSLNTKANEITIAIQNEMESVQYKYDADTNNGLNTTNQEIWASCVSGWLNTVSPNTTCQMTSNSNTSSSTITPKYFEITRMESSSTGAIATVGSQYSADIGFTTVPEVIKSNSLSYTIQGLPSGLYSDGYLNKINYSNNGYVTFKGSPTQSGNFPITIKFTDPSNGINVNKTFYLNVNPSSSSQTPTPVTCSPTTTNTTPVSGTNNIGTITITSPNGGDCLTKGSSKTITWSSSSNIDKVTISFVSIHGIETNIATNIPNTGSLNWIVNVGNTVNTQFKINILGYQTGTGSVSDQSDNFFSVN